MKIALIGKGGAGKTTAAGVLARAFARRGGEVVALDCDSNANLGLSLGMGVDTAEHLVSLREQLDAGEAEHADTPDALLERFGRSGPDGLRFVVVARIEQANPGCPCCGMSPHELLDTLDAPSRVVIADLEAGIGTLTRVQEGSIDVAVLLAEPTAKSLDVAERARDLAVERRIGRVVVVANRIRDDADLEMIVSRLDGLDVVAVPDDAVVERAEREGLAPLEVDPDAPAVRALVALAEQLGEPQAVV